MNHEKEVVQDLFLTELLEVVKDRIMHTNGLDFVDEPLKHQVVTMLLRSMSDK